MTAETPEEPGRVPVGELRETLQTLRGLAEDKREKAREATSAQSKKYNQAAAYAYTISANTLEGHIKDYE
jgi:methyl coenzyme M reductase alpha subunit